MRQHTPIWMPQFRAASPRWRSFKLLLACALALLLLPLIQPFAVAATLPPPPPNPPGTPNRYDPTQNTPPAPHKFPAPAIPTHQIPATPTLLQHPMPVTAPLLLNVTAAGAHGTTANGRLEVTVPAGAVSAADLTGAGGAVTLRVIQVSPPAGSTGGGSGLASFGSWSFQPVDATGKVLTHSLALAPTLTLHYDVREGAFAPDQALAIFNSERDVHQAEISAVLSPTADGSPSRATFGASASQRAIHDPKARTLTVTLPGPTGVAKGAHALTTNPPSTTVTWMSSSPTGAFGKPATGTVNYSTGALTTSVGIDVPPGPGGLTPNLALSYNSDAVAEQHDPQGTAGCVGEGWSLGLGQISWAEVNSAPYLGNHIWEDTWQLTDPYGNSTTLIPPNRAVTTYYDNSSNTTFPNPVQWHGVDDNHLTIYSYNGPVAIGDPNGVTPPCWRVWLPNGVIIV